MSRKTDLEDGIDQQQDIVTCNADYLTFWVNGPEFMPHT